MLHCLNGSAAFLTTDFSRGEQIGFEEETNMVTHQGNPVSKGAAVGRVYKYVPYQAVVEQTGIRPEQVEEELSLIHI